jgi:hypothetical protein
LAERASCAMRLFTESTRTALTDWIGLSRLASDDFLFPSRVHASPHLSTRQYARIVDSWVEEIGLDPAAYGTHSIRRTKPSDLSTDQESARCAATVGPHEALKHGSLPWHRGRGRNGVGRANRSVTLPRLSRIDRKSRSNIRLRRPWAAVPRKQRALPDGFGNGKIRPKVTASGRLILSERARLGVRPSGLLQNLQHTTAAREG